ncbi:MAG: sporulation protein Cse60 [Melioribacteraceae bacterium]|nr:sporulation protein Cse60 [Melioribacteraceae bacterium]
MKSKVISIISRDFESKLNFALEALEQKNIVDIKFTQSINGKGEVILSALILYK